MPKSKPQKFCDVYDFDFFNSPDIRDINEKVCRDLPTFKHTDGNHFCILHQPTRAMNLRMFQQIFDERIAEIDRRIKEVEKLAGDEQETERNKLSYDFRFVWIPSELDLRKKHLKASANFSSATFSCPVDFRWAIFSSATKFSSATFSSAANFSSARFSSAADFSRTIFASTADFTASRFASTAYFIKAIFSSTAHFNGVTYGSAAYFMKATYSSVVSFSKTTFSSDVNFGQAAFLGEAYFNSTTFSSSANFIKATFSERVRFYLAEFASVDFRECIFGKLEKVEFHAAL